MILNAAQLATPVCQDSGAVQISIIVTVSAALQEKFVLIGFVKIFVEMRVLQQKLAALLLMVVTSAVQKIQPASPYKVYVVLKSSTAREVAVHLDKSVLQVAV